MFKIIFGFLIFFSNYAFAQRVYEITGKVTDANSHILLPGSTVNFGHKVISHADGSFKMSLSEWPEKDSLRVAHLGYAPYAIFLIKKNKQNLVVELQASFNNLDQVSVRAGKENGKTLVEKVIENKNKNNSEKSALYQYQNYSRNEIDIDNINLKASKSKNLKALMSSIYLAIDSSAKYDKELPIYFSETLSRLRHSGSSDSKVIISKKSLGLKTDDLMRHLEKFYIKLNIYDNWLPVFDQSFVSPLHDHSSDYYKFYIGDSIIENGETVTQIRFSPSRQYEHAFSGSMWVNNKTFAVQSFRMNLSKTANLNFVQNIDYSEEYKTVYDSAGNSSVSLPSSFLSEVKFEGGMGLLGIPVPDDKNTLHLLIRSSTTIEKVELNASSNKPLSNNIGNDASSLFKNEEALLSLHEKNIYRMVDSLKKNSRFKNDVRLLALIGTGYWDFGDKVRIGPYSSFISNNTLEGWRFRTGFWTMQGLSRKFNIYGYAAYGTKDKVIKGGLGLKYIWDSLHWSKSTFWYGQDYDLIIDQNDELDNDNIISSLFRKNLPVMRIFVRQASLVHEQYISHDITTKFSFDYKELTPSFYFKYRSINPVSEKPYDSLFDTKLPLAEGAIGFRYAHKERTTFLNYDRLQLESFFPVISVKYAFGLALNKAAFEYQKIDLTIQQKLRLPPKALLYYTLNTGKIIGMLPYIALNVPAGNEYYVSSKYRFNTMTTYEFAADIYLGFHSTISFAGILLGNIPFIKKLGWRERASFNLYMGGMSHENQDYNKNARFYLTGKNPFMEAGVGLENIFHVFSIDYYRRLSHLDNINATRDGVYAGVTLNF